MANSPSWAEVGRATDLTLQQEGAGKIPRFVARVQMGGLHAGEIIYKITTYTQFLDSAFLGGAFGFLISRGSNDFLAAGIGAGLCLANEGFKRVKNQGIRQGRYLITNLASSLMLRGFTHQTLGAGLLEGFSLGTLAEGSRVVRSAIEKSVTDRLNRFQASGENR